MSEVKNAIFVANKPARISSNHFLSRIKRKYKVKKAGFSGTLDPFASGCLIVALGNYTRLFNYIDKGKKTYIATMWLGVKSQSMDNQNISEITTVKPFVLSSIEIARSFLLGDIEYVPPKYSAKHVNGERAYDLARRGVEFELKATKMHVYESQILSYCHPFLTFSVTLSEGGYVRSYANLLAKKLGVNATLSALHRVSEGEFRYDNERFLDPIEVLNLPLNEYSGEISNILDGKNIEISQLKFKQNGKYLLKYDKFFSIILVQNNEVKYCLNKVEIC
ncbi:tRNA pseudouridine synthase B [Campylobacter majalis]|uniref:tRNA pseudouridine synthase B n=1 Tax=Campylobacter majalis TaxID=2790656 RepID=A0ABM8Q8S4_9BACT|nr:tRNA pseudouridine(55) synthase TruB [Campylobacter majalis]CAD7289380.1 tRNA pseudouridine synthase B [Campylobacter majalis]